MKKYPVLIILLVVTLLCSISFAATKISALTNLAAGKSAYGTFSNAPLVCDGKTKGLSASSGDITDMPQYLTIDLKTSAYLDRVKIFWDGNALSNDFAVRTSPDAKYWNTEAENVDAAQGIVDPSSGKTTISISLQRMKQSSKYIQIMVPAGTKTSNKTGNTVSIAEVEVYPSLAQKFTLDSFGAYAINDNSCIIKYSTSIGAASGSVLYGTDPNKLNNTAGNTESGTVNSAVLSGLKPRTTYFYQVKAVDAYGNPVASKTGNFATASENIALKKKVSGTFTVLPADKFIQKGDADNVLSRVTDGSTNYFSSMATSGSVYVADQYVVIDLGRSYKIKNIVSYWRKLAYPESLVVQVSDNNTDWVNLEAGADVGKGGFARSDTGDPMEVLNTPGSTGRYIKLLVAKGSPFFHKHSDWNFVQLMEVKVFAD